MATVLDIVILLEGGDGAILPSPRGINVYQMPEQWICLHGSISPLQCNISACGRGKPGFRNKKAAVTVAFEVKEGLALYSAACLRGGSSAPESWISAT